MGLDFRMQLRLEHSYILQHLDSQYQRYNAGLRLIETADRHFEQKNLQDCITCIFEGLGWLYLSGITKHVNSILAVERAKRLLDEIHQTLFKDLRLSMEQVEIYSEIAEFFLSGDELKNAKDIISSSNEVIAWMSPIVEPKR